MSLAFAALAFLASAASAASITEFEIEPGAPLGVHQPRYIHPGPEGNLWYSESGSKAGIGRISPTGERFPEISDPNGPVDFVFTADGTLYWTSDQGFGRRTTQGDVSIGEQVTLLSGYAIALTASGSVRAGLVRVGNHPSFCHLDEMEFGKTDCHELPGSGRLTGLLLGPGNVMWDAFPEKNVLWLSSGEEVDVQTPIELPVGSEPLRLALGSDGNVWVTMYGADAIDRFLPDGTRTRFQLPSGSEPADIVAGPDGALWFTEFGSEKIGRMTTSGAVTEYSIPSPNSEPIGLTVGPERNIWFTESGTGKIGRLVPDAPPTGGSGGGGGGASGGSPGGGTVNDKGAAPRFTVAPSFAPHRFAVAGASAAKKKGGSTPKGGKLDLSLSGPATVTATISRSSPGRRKGRNCVAPGVAPKGAVKCKRQVVVGTVSWSAPAGASALLFTGKVGGRALKPGTYAASIVAKDSAGRVSEERQATFAIAAG